MSAKVDQYFDRLRDRLKAIEGWLDSIVADIRALPWKVRRAHQRMLHEARAKLRAQKERVEQTRTELKSPPQSAVELLVESVIDWKANPEELEPHAGTTTAEARAAATIDHAVAGIDEVGEAILYATAARLHDTTK